jgi:hypothetical protein
VSFPPGHLVEHPLPAGIVGALGLGGYQLLVDLAGVGAGRLGRQAFLLVAPEPEPSVPDPGTQIVLHHDHLREEREAAVFAQLAAQLGYLRLSGYRLALERAGVRSRLHVVDPASGAIRASLPERHPRRLLGRGAGAAALLEALRALPPAGPPPDAGADRELLRQALLALALGDEHTSGAEAAELAERALALVGGPKALDLPAALQAARSEPIT